MTGQIAALVATKLLIEEQPFGVFYLEELFSLNDLNDFQVHPSVEMLCQEIASV